MLKPPPVASRQSASDSHGWTPDRLSNATTWEWTEADGEIVLDARRGADGRDVRIDEGTGDARSGALGRSLLAVHGQDGERPAGPQGGDHPRDEQVQSVVVGRVEERTQPVQLAASARGEGAGASHRGGGT